MSDFILGISLEHLIKGDARFKKVILEGNYRRVQVSIVDFLYDFWWLFFPVAGFLVWSFIRSWFILKMKI